MAREIFQKERLLAVLCGGFLGTIARYFLSLFIQGMVGKGWPYDILLINVTGAFLFAILSTLADAALFIGPRRRLFLNVGFMGAYTTFSSLALGAVSLFASAHPILALLYVVSSLVGGILAVLLGQYAAMLLVSVVKHRRPMRSIQAAGDASPLSRRSSTLSLEEEERRY